MDGNKLKEWLIKEIDQASEANNKMYSGFGNGSMVAFSCVLNALENGDFDEPRKYVPLEEYVLNKSKPTLIDQRYELAKAAMESLLSNSAYATEANAVFANGTPAGLSKFCVWVADEMIKQLNAEKK